MGKTIFLLLALTIAFLNPLKSQAQSKAKIEISTIKQKGETVKVTVSSSKPFIFGSNKYILHIGDKICSHYEQTKKEGKGYLAFLVPSSEYKALTNGANIYLTYGHVDEDANLEALSKQNARCWALGTFNKVPLTK